MPTSTMRAAVERTGCDGRPASARPSLSVFDLFTIGVGPSSSHTVGPMRAARLFAEALRDQGLLPRVERLQIDLFGSLGATGVGHRSDVAVILGLEGHSPESVDTAGIPALMARIRRDGTLRVLGEHVTRFAPATDLRLRAEVRPCSHANAMLLEAFDAGGTLLDRRSYESVGGGVVVESGCQLDQAASGREAPRLAFSSAGELLQLCSDHRLSVGELVLRNESTWRDEAEVRSELLHIWGVMKDCIRRGCCAQGRLPGGLGLRRRAPRMRRLLREGSADLRTHPFSEMDLLSLHAMAVAEENAAGGRVVTAPTNGSAGIVPAVLQSALRTADGEGDDLVVEFLLVAGAIGALYKQNASISGAEVGCQGEIGVACSMAAAGLAEVLGATPEQVETAAEIGMEHNLGLTCDPVAGLVQVPCIERNAMGAVMAVAAARLALQECGDHLVSLDSVIETMHVTGRDMCDSYKETARGGLAAIVPRASGETARC